MEEKMVTNRLLCGAKGFLYAFLLFAASLLIIGVLLRFTGLPERWMPVYVMAALSVSCLILGLFAGYAMKRKGFLYGALFSVIFLLCVISLALVVAGTGIHAEPSQFRYLICIVCGMIGGMIGVNVRV